MGIDVVSALGPVEFAEGEVPSVVFFVLERLAPMCDHPRCNPESGILSPDLRGNGFLICSDDREWNDLPEWVMSQ